MTLFAVAAFKHRQAGGPSRIFATLCATVAAFAILTVAEAPFATQAHAQVSCPLPGVFITNQRFTFDEDAGTCVAASTNPINGFKIIADSDDLELDQVRTNAVANGDFDTAGSYAAHALTAVSVSPIAGGTITALKNAGSGNFGLEFDTNAVKSVQTYALSFTKAGTAYTITVIGEFGDLAPSPIVTSIVITGGIFGPVIPPTPIATRDEGALRKQTQRVISNFLARRADQITMSAPDLVDRLRRPASGTDSNSPLDVTANGTGSNGQAAFSTSMSQLANSARELGRDKASGTAPAGRPERLEGAMALGRNSSEDAGPAIYSQPYNLTPGFDLWTQGTWSHIDEANQETEFGIVHFGAEYKVNAALLVGVMGQVDWTEQKSGADGVGADGLGWMAGPYVVSRLHQNLYFDARASWGQSENNVNAFGSFSDAFQTERWLARAQLTGDFSAGNWNFNPFAAVTYFEEDQEAFYSKLNLTIPDQKVSLGRVAFGPKVSYRWQTQNAVIEPHLSFTGVWDFEQAGQFNVSSGQAIGSEEFRGRVEGGISAFLAGGWSIQASGFYDGIGAGDYDAYGASIALSAPLVLPTDQFGDVVKTRISGIAVEALAMRPSDLKDVPMTGRGIAVGLPTPFAEFRTDELNDQSFTPGLRATVNATLFNHPIELSGFFLSTIKREATKLNLGEGVANPLNTNAIYHPENDPGADIDSTNSENIYGLVAHHQTKLYGAEANVLSSFGVPGLSLGARGLYYGEEFATTTFEEADDVPGGTDTNPDRDQVTVRTDNYMLGLQAGLQGMFDINPYLSVGGSVAGGLYANRVERRRTFRSANVSTRFQDSTLDDTVLAQAVEVRPRLDFRIAEGWTLSASGSLLWLNNVSDAVSHYATATDLQDRDIRADKDVFFWGGSLGLKYALENWGTNSGDEPSSSESDVAAAGASYDELEERIADLEASTARKGTRAPITLSVSGWINQGLLAWDDGVESDVNQVQFVSARSRLEFAGSAKIARGWSAGYLLGLGINDNDSTDVSQITDEGDDDPTLVVRHSNWWLRSNKFGTATVGFGSTATDNIILEDTGGIIAGAQNIATIGGNLIVRHADEPEEGPEALITRTTMSDFAAGASVDTLRRNMVRYDAPRIHALGGNIDVSAAVGEDDFFDAAIRYDVNFNDFRFRSGIGYLHDTDEPDDRTGSERDRQEIKGSASIIHVPSGIFLTAAFVHREFHGSDPSDQAIFGENTTGIVTPAGTNRPDTEYRYFASGIRHSFSRIGDTTVYGEYGRVDDAITGLREAGYSEVTESQLEMIGASISQDIEAAGMDIYAGFRHFKYETSGANVSGASFVEGPEPLTDLMMFFAGSRVKF